MSLSTAPTPMGLAAHWTAQPVWGHEVSNNDKGEFIRGDVQVFSGYDPLIDKEDVARCVPSDPDRSIHLRGGAVLPETQVTTTINLGAGVAC